MFPILYKPGERAPNYRLSHRAGHPTPAEARAGLADRRADPGVTNNQTVAVIEVREPTDDVVGCVSARVGAFGPEICYAVGREFGDWYVAIQPVVAAVAGVEHERTIAAGGRRDAEHLVRLIAALYERAAGQISA